jgi:diguanylate cyclase (GGDEF)-like protein
MGLSIFSKLLLCFFIAISFLIVIVLSVSNSLNSSFVEDLNQQVGDSLAESTYQLLLNHTQTSLDYLEEEVREDIYFSDSDSIQDELSKFTKDENIDAIIVLDKNRAVLATKANVQIKNLLEISSLVNQGLTDKKQVVMQIENNIILARKLYIYDELVGVIIISTNQTYYNSELQKLFDTIHLSTKQHGDSYLTQLSLIILLFCLFFIVFISVVLSRITEPLRQLKSDINKFGNDTQNTNIFIKHSNDEIGLLARSFYQMSLKVRKREKQISQLAATDMLTQLNNRASLINKIANLIDSERCQHLMCVYLDLDNFKDINDAFGHEEGDRLIKEVAKRLSKLTSFEYQDEMVNRSFKDNLFIARLGGDEFVLLFQFDQQTPYSDSLSKKLAQQVLYAFEGKLLHYNTSASFGIALFPQDGNNVEDLLKTADIAMYHAKSLGRNQYQFFSQEMSTALVRARLIEEALQNLLDNNLSDQLYMAYQPQYQLQEDRLIGAESLIRWNHPDYGSISPAEFIPIAERRGLITEFSLLTFDLLIADMLILKNYCSNRFMISWNLSSIVLVKPDIADILAKKLHEKGLKSKNISIEITETAFISDLELANKSIFLLQQKGFEVWLDDFGTGYSSLSILSDVPIDGLKIDRSFVNKIEQIATTSNINQQTETENNSVIIDAFINLADTLKLGVVAEGIETQFQLNYLKGLNCTYGQGYYLGKPMPLKALIEVI